MKKLSNLKGAKALSKKEQQSINGGKFCHDDSDCPTRFGYVCNGWICVRVMQP